MTSRYYINRIAFDVQGGDPITSGISVTVRGALLAAQECPDTLFILVGDQDLIREAVNAFPSPPINFAIHHAPGCVTTGMSGQQLSETVTSMGEAARLAAQDRADGFATLGDSKAIAYYGRDVIGYIPGTKRACISTLFPGFKLPSLRPEKFVTLDSGLNIDANPRHYFAITLMGIAHAHSLGIAKPRVAVLANGDEDHKGNKQSKAIFAEAKRAVDAYNLAMGEEVATFVGNREPKHLLHHHDADVMICDGLVGNIFLKTAEAVAELFTTFLKYIFHRDTVPSTLVQKCIKKLWELLLLPFAKRLRELKAALNGRGGGCLLGYTKQVTKIHNFADSEAVRAALVDMAKVLELRLPGHISRVFEAVIPQTDAADEENGE